MSIIILWFVWMLFLFVPMKEAMHMFQQNRYQIARYHTWLRQDRKRHRDSIFRLWISFIPIFSLILIKQDTYPISLLILLLFMYCYLILKWDDHQSYIKNIVYTHRIKRLYGAMILFYTLLYFLFMLCPFYVFIIWVPFSFFSPWLLLPFIANIMKPIEESIRKYYVNDAKQILSQQGRLRIIGITGSYGKTSVKHILCTLLNEQYYTFMTPQSYNNLMGITLSIRTMLKSLHEVFIVEMGADHVHEIRELAQFVNPQYAIITAVGPQHLETFGTQANILHEKMQLVEHLPSEGVAVLNWDNALIRSYHIQNTCSIQTYGIHQEDVDVAAKDIRYQQTGTSFRVVRKMGEDFDVHTCLLGEHNVLNILGAITMALYLRLSVSQIQIAVARLRFVEHRLQIRKNALYTLLDDAYNANPQGAAYALDVLAQMEGNHILMTPGFLDLGQQQTQAHQTFAKQMMNSCDWIILIGKEQTAIIEETLITLAFDRTRLLVVDTTKEAFRLLQTIVQKGDTVLIENDLPDAFNH